MHRETSAPLLSSLREVKALLVRRRLRARIAVARGKVATKTHVVVRDSYGSSPLGSFIALATVDTHVPIPKANAPPMFNAAWTGCSSCIAVKKTKTKAKIDNPAPSSVADVLLSGLFMVLICLRFQFDCPM